jgi:hypothetical protein
MQMKNDLALQNASTQECRFVEVLTSDKTGDVIGYRFGGGRPGPNVMAAAYAPISDYMFERMSDLPTLPWMWGSLFIINLDALADDEARDPLNRLAGVPIDALLTLPISSLEGNETTAADQSYWATLKLCADLGMIQGRGLAARNDWATDHLIHAVR